MPLTNTTMLGLANRFVVTIDDHDLGSWAKCEGLDVKWDVASYKSGDGGNMTIYHQGGTTYSTIKLTRAACEETMQVKDWLNKTSFNHQLEMTGSIKLCDSSGKPVADWELRYVLPSKWSITGFDAGASKVATETLELVHHGFLDDDVVIGG